ncbi:MAG: S4 domain-containing protein, partial [Dehalococcoidales bacterium]
EEYTVSFDKFREYLTQLGQSQGGATGLLSSPIFPSVININKLLVATSLVKSHSEVGRLINQGAVSVNGEKITSNLASLKSGDIIKVGKRRFARVIDTDKE